MKQSEILLAEIKQEAIATRKLLELVPFEKADYKPHEKSMTLLRLATHVAEISGWWKECLLDDELDFAKGDHKPKVLTSTADIVALHDKHILQAEKILTEISEEEFAKPWTMRAGETIFFPNNPLPPVTTITLSFIENIHIPFILNYKIHNKYYFFCHY